MKSQSTFYTFSTSWTLIAACLAFLSLSATAHEPETTIPDPGFRPQSEYAQAFLDSLDTATVAVLPTIVRRADRSAHSFASQRQIVDSLNDVRITNAVAKPKRIDLGPLPRLSQWQIFENALHGTAQSIEGYQTDADYTLVMEFLVPGNQSVFGIECYIVDNQGRNAFSFLLNSHHQIFADANLVAENFTEAARARMIEEATRVGLAAFIQQIRNPLPQQTEAQKNHSVPAETLTNLDHELERIFVVAKLQERLVHVFMHSFKHSLASAFQENDLGVTLMVAPKESEPLVEFEDQINKYAPDAIMLINIDPLYRTRKDGYQAIVGTEFEVTLIDKGTDQRTWQSSGKVDYIRMFGPKYVAHDGIRKEFAWSTTAAIVQAYMADLHGKDSAPIYTVTEDRERHGQRTD